MSNFFDATTGVPVKALRGKQGSRIMYLTLPDNDVLNNFFPRDMEVGGAEGKSQRPYDPSRAEQIGGYIVENQEDYVLGALTYAMDVDGTFEEVEPGAEIGRLIIPLDARLRSIDGQHRRGGIKEALEQWTDLGKQSTGLIIYVESDLERRRQMFSDMNWHQKPVSRSINVGFDQRDPFARVTQSLIDEHPLLKGRVESERTSVAKHSDKLFTMGAVYDAIGRCFVGTGGRLRNKSKWADDEASIKRTAIEFLDALVSARPEFQGLIDGRPSAALRDKTLLASSTTLKVLGGAYHIVVTKRKRSPKEFTEGLAQINFAPHLQQWRKIGFVAEGKTTPNARLQEMKAASDFIADKIAPKGGAQ